MERGTFANQREDDGTSDSGGGVIPSRRKGKFRSMEAAIQERGVAKWGIRVIVSREEERGLASRVCRNSDLQ